MSGSFGDLLKQAGLRASEAGPAEPTAEATSAPEAIRYADKVVVRLQRKGRGGKTVTILSGVLAGRARLAKLLRKQMGTGSRVDGEDLVLQGEQVERAARWLESQGVKKVVRG